MRRLLACWCGTCALAMAVVSAALALGIGAPPSLTDALLGHAIATGLAILAALAAPGTPRPLVVAIAVTAAAAPLFGPALAWTFVWRRSGTRDAHREFEAGEARHERDDAGSVRGDTSVASYALVLRDGSLERKRNLLRRLGEVGGAEQLAVLRRCLTDPEPEVRLCAYGELERLCRAHEDRIATLRSATGEHAARSAGDRAIDLADACLGYASSGLLDDDMAKYWSQQAARAAAAALDADPGDWRAPCRLARATMALGELGESAACLDRLADSIRPEVVLARCELDFLRKDFKAARRGGRLLAELGTPLPAWLAALGAGAGTAGGSR